MPISTEKVTFCNLFVIVADTVYLPTLTTYYDSDHWLGSLAVYCLLACQQTVNSTNWSSALLAWPSLLDPDLADLTPKSRSDPEKADLTSKIMTQNYALIGLLYMVIFGQLVLKRCISSRSNLVYKGAVWHGLFLAGLVLLCLRFSSSSCCLFGCSLLAIHHKPDRETRKWAESSQLQSHIMLIYNVNTLHVAPIHSGIFWDRVCA